MHAKTNDLLLLVFPSCSPPYFPSLRSREGTGGKRTLVKEEGKVREALILLWRENLSPRLPTQSRGQVFPGPPRTEWCGFFLQQSWRKNRTGPQLPTYGGYRAAWVPSLIPRLPSLRLVAGDYI
jgi:hypothetical protein